MHLVLRAKRTKKQKNFKNQNKRSRSFEQKKFFKLLDKE